VVSFAANNALTIGEPDSRPLIQMPHLVADGRNMPSEIVEEGR